MTIISLNSLRRKKFALLLIKIFNVVLDRHKWMQHHLTKFFNIFQDEQLWGTNKNLYQFYLQNIHPIRVTETLNRCSRLFFLYPKTHLIETVSKAIKKIISISKTCFQDKFVLFIHFATQRDRETPILLCQQQSRIT